MTCRKDRRAYNRSGMHEKYRQEKRECCRQLYVTQVICRKDVDKKGEHITSGMQEKWTKSVHNVMFDLRSGNDY